ncbi:hypothetical protein QMK19_11390 [Streptomyces sp. H10-C2]|uniref:hypothetical protein n=1 Tax=unclassified Streptomyces TaxID=2593676 RepID=UPI0024BAA7D8|nr:MULTISPECIES: hypothetical protein [unclassified Streptomyces]MDJ0340614.1 hypothetical protein [Streptomyces sp. PH10-H1]MDJ0370262.1 hypothetical protein [Streptomyces sp. H10-C2]
MPAHGTTDAPDARADASAPKPPAVPPVPVVPALPSMSELLAAGLAATAVCTPPDETAGERRDAA